jgi:hypothetical protein
MENSLQLLIGAVALVVCGQLVLERVVPVFARVSSLVPVGLGLFLGSSSAAIAPSSEGGTLALFTALGLGLLGFFAGTRLLERQPDAAEGSAARLAGVLTTASLIGVGILSYLGLRYQGEIDLSSVDSLVVPVALAACAGAAGAHSLSRLFESLGRSDGQHRTAVIAARILEAQAICLVGVMVLIRRSGQAPYPDLSLTEWIAIAVLGSALVGILLSAFTKRLSASTFVVLAMGFVLAAMGAAQALNAVPLFVGFVMGLGLRRGQRSDSGELWGLEPLERPAHLLVLFLAAFAWRFHGGSVALVAMGFVGLQLAAMLAASLWAFRTQREPLVWRRWPGPLWLAQGGMPAGIALTTALMLGPESVASALLITASLATVVVNEVVVSLAAAGLTRVDEQGEAEADPESTDAESKGEPTSVSAGAEGRP